MRILNLVSCIRNTGETLFRYYFKFDHQTIQFFLSLEDCHLAIETRVRMSVIWFGVWKEKFNLKSHRGHVWITGLLRHHNGVMFHQKLLSIRTLSWYKIHELSQVQDDNTSLHSNERVRAFTFDWTPTCLFRSSFNKKTYHLDD